MIFLRKESLQLELFSFAVILATLIPVLSPAADSPAPAQPMPAQTAAPQPGNVLTLDEAIQIALENHPSIKASKERIGAQEAVVGQQVAAYYPTISMTNFYQTGNQAGTTTGVTPNAFETYLARTGVNMTLYNFGKREGTVQSARDTLDATNFNYKTTVDGVILGVKQSYFAYLGAQGPGESTEKKPSTAASCLHDQAQGFYEVGTRARIDVARAESNLYLAEANLITAQNAVKIAWSILKTRWA